MLIDICLPIYNEEKILKENVIILLTFCLQQNFNFTWRLVLLVNGSSDKSLAIAKGLAADNIGKVLVKNITLAGKGSALKSYLIESQADIFVYMDIDLAVSLNDLLKLIYYLTDDGYDLAIGSRLLPESKVNRSVFRETSSQGYNILSRIILNNHISDLQCGFKAIKKQAFKKIFPYLAENKWFFDTELVSYAIFFGYKIKEIPVDWSENRYETRKSKVNVFKDSLKFFINLIKLKRQLLSLKKKNISRY